MQSCARTYSPQCQYQSNGYGSSNGYSGSNGHAHHDSNGYSNYESKTYTSTLTIQTSDNSNGFSNGQNELLDYNRNSTNDTECKLQKLTGDIRDFALCDDRDSFCCAKTELTAPRGFKVTD